MRAGIKQTPASPKQPHQHPRRGPRSPGCCSVLPPPCAERPRTAPASGCAAKQRGEGSAGHDSPKGLRSLGILFCIKACTHGRSICFLNFQQPSLISWLFAYLMASRALKPGCAAGYAAYGGTSQSSQRGSMRRVPCPVFQHMVGAIQAGGGEHNAKPLGGMAYGSGSINAGGVLLPRRTGFLFTSSSATVNWLLPSVLLSVVWFSPKPGQARRETGSLAAPHGFHQEHGDCPGLGQLPRHHTRAV